MTSSVPSAQTSSVKSIRQYVLVYGGLLLLSLLCCYVVLLVTGEINIRSLDFFDGYSASRMVVVGQGGLIYDHNAFAQMERQVWGNHGGGLNIVPSIYPPQFVLFWVPLAAIPYDLAYPAWLALNCLMLAASIFFLERLANLSTRAGTVCRYAAFLAFPTLFALLEGQPSIALLILFTGSLVALHSGRDVLAGILLGATLIKPQYVPALVLVLLVRKHWRGVAAFAGTTAFLGIIPMPLMGPSIDWSFANYLLHPSQLHFKGGLFAPMWNRGFDAFFSLLLPHRAALIATIIASVVAVLLLVYCAKLATDIYLPYALAIVVALLLSPHVLIHDLVLLLIPGYVMARHRNEGPRHLNTLLWLCYWAMPVGFVMAVVTPIQLPVLAMCAMGAWIAQAILRPQVTAEGVPPSPIPRLIRWGAPQGRGNTAR